jgi:hypothetical protein
VSRPEEHPKRMFNLGGVVLYHPGAIQLVYQYERHRASITAIRGLRCRTRTCASKLRSTTGFFFSRGSGFLQDSHIQLAVFIWNAGLLSTSPLQNHAPSENSFITLIVVVASSTQRCGIGFSQKKGVELVKYLLLIFGLLLEC